MSVTEKVGDLGMAVEEAVLGKDKEKDDNET